MSNTEPEPDRHADDVPVWFRRAHALLLIVCVTLSLLTIAAQVLRFYGAK